MVEAEDIAYRVGGRELVGGITARFEPGRVHLIIGPNGAGKSTLIKVLSRLLRPSTGVVRYDQADVARAAEPDLAKSRAVLSQAIELAFPLTVREVVMMGRYPHFGSRAARHDEAIVDEVMRYFGVTDMSERSYPTLSGGEKQRVNFARVLAQVWEPTAGRSRVLFLDEPLTFLDIAHQLTFMNKVREAAAAGDLVVIGVVHDLSLAARFGDRLLLLHGGRTVADGPPDAVLTPANVRLAFDVEMASATVAGSPIRHLIFGP